MLSRLTRALKSTAPKTLRTAQHSQVLTRALTAQTLKKFLTSTNVTQKVELKPAITNVTQIARDNHQPAQTNNSSQNNMQNNSKTATIFTAAQDGDIELLKILAKKAKENGTINDFDESGTSTALHYAAWTDECESRNNPNSEFMLTRILLQAGANPNIGYNDGYGIFYPINCVTNKDLKQLLTYASAHTFDYKNALLTYQLSRKQIAIDANKRWQAFQAKEQEINARDNKILEAQRLKFFSHLKNKFSSYNIKNTFSEHNNFTLSPKHGKK